MTAWNWPPSSSGGGGGGGGGGTASELATTGAAVDVSGAAPPVAGQVLTAVDATHSIWRVPGLHYDPAIRFNVNAGGDATIEPGTWGFVYTSPVGVTEINIFVVSSLTAPPVDSRFGLYVSPSQTLPVNVSLIGASQIQALDGTLDTSITLPPGSFYEWLFYHEGGNAIWGLVNYTLSPLATIAQTADSPIVMDFAVTENQVLSGNSGVYDGVTVASDKFLLLAGQTDPTENGLWQTHDGPWTRLAAPTPIGQGVVITDGNSLCGSLWAYLGNNVWVPISVGDALVGGVGLQRNGKSLNVLYGTTASTAAQGNDARLSNARTPTAHAATHRHGGSDEVATATPAANAIPKADASGKLDAWITPSGGGGETTKILSADFNGTGPGIWRQVTPLGFPIAANAYYYIEWTLFVKRQDFGVNSFIGLDTTPNISGTFFNAYMELRKTSSSRVEASWNNIGINVGNIALVCSPSSSDDVQSRVLVKMGLRVGATAATIYPAVQSSSGVNYLIQAGSFGRLVSTATPV